MSGREWMRITGQTRARVATLVNPRSRLARALDLKGHFVMDVKIGRAFNKGHYWTKELFLDLPSSQRYGYT